jgi:hypothetical protein
MWGEPCWAVAIMIGVGAFYLGAQVGYAKYYFMQVHRVAGFRKRLAHVRERLAAM